MKMKQFMFAAMAALAITSCSQNEELDALGSKSEIKIGSIVSKTTRAAITDMAALQVTGFTVYAYNVGDGTGKLDNAIMSGALATASENVWTIGGGPYYWPLSEKVNFFAFPTGVSATYDVAADAASPTITYKVVKESANQVDLVLAKLTDQGAAENAIALPFAHVLTQVNFSVKGADALKYVVSSVKITGVSEAGTYSFENDQWTVTDEPASEYSYALGENALNVGTGVVVLDQADGALMLMPQAMTASAKINLVYKIYDGESLLYDTTEAGVNVDLGNSAAWGAGKKIRYTLTLANKAAAIKLTPEVGSWTTPEENMPK